MKYFKPLKIARNDFNTYKIILNCENPIKFVFFEIHNFKKKSPEPPLKADRNSEKPGAEKI